MTDSEETYLLLLLSDSNLPTGAFVASSGLESYLKHGISPSGGPRSSTPAELRVLAFLSDSLASYGRTSIPFVSDAHEIVAQVVKTEECGETGVDAVLERLMGLDEGYEAQTLNHVARRASKSQGAALLTLYTKGFSRPTSLAQFADPDTGNREKRLSHVVESFKRRVRREETAGHLPICWGILTAALGLTLDRAQYLHLFLHARGLLSASIRLNEIGPYNAQQILLHAVQPLVANEVLRCKNLRSGVGKTPERCFDQSVDGPANTWPLGEILATRHDLQHSRIFNS